MKLKFVLLCVIASLPLAGCKKLVALFHRTLAPQVAAAQTTPAPALAPAPAAPTTTPGPAINKAASAIVLCYHNIEDSSKMKALTISIAEFTHEMQAIKDAGITVIPMQQFLAFRRGEKDIPAKSAIITIDDGWVSAYNNAWPILKKFNYPFTLFIYINYIGAGGKSMSWDELAEMRDAGVDIECHTYSHSDLKAPGFNVDKTTAALVRKDVATLGVDGWLRKEIIGSKEVLEKQLAIKANVFAYPFGKYNAKARELVKEAGYEAAFTVYGQRLGFSQPPYDLLGRYAVVASQPQIFADALKILGGPASAGPAVAQLAAASMITRPADGETISDPRPVIKANLATMGDIEGVEMRLSGFGQVPAKYDAATKTISYQPTEKLHDKNYTVILSAKTKAGERVETRWSFNFDPNAPAEPVETPLPPRANQ